MTLRRLTEVVLRVWGLMLLVRAIIAASQQLGFILAGSASDEAVFRAQSISMIGGVLVFGAAAVIVLLFAPAIAERIVGEDAPVSTSVSFAEALVVGLSLLALVFAVSGGREVVMAVYTLATKARWDQTPSLEYVWEQRRAAVVMGMFELLVGIGVLLRRHALTAWLASSRGGAEHADGDGQ